MGEIEQYRIEDVLEQEWIASGANESFISWLSSQVIKARTESVKRRLRGDTYRRRALALQLRAKSQRSIIKILQSMLKDAILDHNALRKQVVRRDHWIDEALNRGNGLYRP